MEMGKVTQLTNEGIDCLSKIRKFDEGTMRLTKEDAANILDALNEWDLTIGAKELNDDEVGLDYQRWVELKLRLMDFVEDVTAIENQKKGWVCKHCGKSTFEVEYDYLADMDEHLGCALEKESGILTVHEAQKKMDKMVSKHPQIKHPEWLI
jgi:hypothetical protein